MTMLDMSIIEEIEKESRNIDKLEISRALIVKVDYGVVGLKKAMSNYLRARNVHQRRVAIWQLYDYYCRKNGVEIK